MSNLVVSDKFNNKLFLYRRPHSKKKRIIKKWRKRKANWRKFEAEYTHHNVLCLSTDYCQKISQEAQQKLDYNIMEKIYA